MLVIISVYTIILIARLLFVNAVTAQNTHRHRLVHRHVARLDIIVLAELNVDSWFDIHFRVDASKTLSLITLIEEQQ